MGCHKGPLVHNDPRNWLTNQHSPLMIIKEREPMKGPPSQVNAYLADIGRKGGKKSRRRLSPDDARNMVRVREARRAFREFHAQCFWFVRPDIEITLVDVPEIARGLRQNGGKRGFILAAKLCP